MTDTKNFARTLVTAAQNGLALPRPRPSEFDLSTAYSVQDHFVAAGGEAITGFRAGTTNRAKQRRFNLDEPLFGVLHTGLHASPEATTPAAQFHRPFLEIELAMVVGRRIDAPVSAEQLPGLIKGLALSAIVPDLAFADLEGVGPTDLAAANLVSAAYAIAEHRAPQGMVQDQISMTLFRDDETIDAGNAGTAMDDMWQTARWLVATALRRGYRLDAGQILMVGSIGNAIPLTPGEYRAESDLLPTLSLRVS